MSTQEKTAWFNIVVLSISIIVFFILFIYIRNERPDLSIIHQIVFSYSAYSINALMGFSGLIFRKNKSQIVMDERDKFIQRRSHLLGFRIFWLFFVGINMGIWGKAMASHSKQISIHVLPLLVALGFVVFVAVQSIVMLKLYHSAVDPFAEGQ